MQQEVFNMKTLLKTKHIILSAILFFFTINGCSPSSDHARTEEHDHDAETPQQVWTCSMHPQVRIDKPGKCPICEMPLIPAASDVADTGGTPSLQFPEQAIAMAHIETTRIERQYLTHELKVVGKIAYNETTLATVTTRIDGYAERLYVDFTGVDIKAGEHLAEIYSPDLILAEHELLYAIRDSGTNAATNPLVRLAKLKLIRWGLTEAQVEDLAENQNIADNITLFSPITGTVIEKNIVQNSAFKAGDALYKVANLDSVWAYLDVYEYDLPWIRYGQRVELTSEALPGRIIEGRVTFVQPIVDEATRTIRIPVQVENKDHALKPGMFVSASIQSELGANGAPAPTGVAGMYTCPMHPQILSQEPGSCEYCEMDLVQIPGASAEVRPAHDHEAAAPAYICPMDCEDGKTYSDPGTCPVCGMKLAKMEPAGNEEQGERNNDAGLLAVPVSAVLDSGTRKIVYVEKDRGLFEAREVVLGPRADGFYPVLDGLGDGERVATRGGFLIDSQFQITGHPSLFHPGGMQGSGTAGSGTSVAPSERPGHAH